MMFCNASCTVFNKTNNGYIPLYISKVYWKERYKIDVKTNQRENIKSLSLLIPWSDDITVNKGDIVARGKYETSIKSKNDLDNAFVIDKIEYNNFGSQYIRHISIEGR